MQPIMSIVLYFFESIIDLKGSCNGQPKVLRFHNRFNRPIWDGSSAISKNKYVLHIIKIQQIIH